MSSTSRLTLFRLSVVLGTSLLSATHGSPILIQIDEEPNIDMGSAEFWTRFGIIITLVLLGGVFAGKYFHQLHLKSALSRVGHGGWLVWVGLGSVTLPPRVIRSY